MVVFQFQAHSLPLNVDPQFQTWGVMRPKREGPLTFISSEDYNL